MRVYLRIYESSKRVVQFEKKKTASKKKHVAPEQNSNAGSRENTAVACSKIRPLPSPKFCHCLQRNAAVTFSNLQSLHSGNYCRCFQNSSAVTFNKIQPPPPIKIQPRDELQTSILRQIANVNLVTNCKRQLRDKHKRRLQDKCFDVCIVNFKKKEKILK